MELNEGTDLQKPDKLEHQGHHIDDDMTETTTIMISVHKESETDVQENATESTGMTDDSTTKKSEITLKQRIRTDVIFRRKFIIWLCLCLYFATLGWNLGISGPTLLDLQIISQCTLEEAALFFTAMSAGYLLASFVLPLTFYRFDKFLHIAFGNLGLVFVMSATPWCFYYGIMLTMHLLKGFMCGISELASSTLLIHLMGQDVRTYMQILHFSFTVGGILSPLASVPFLTNINITDPVTVNTEHNYSLSNATRYNNSIILGGNSSTELALPMNPQQSLDVYIVYTISSAISFVPFLLFVVLFLRCDKMLTKSNKDKDKPETTNNLPIELLIPVMITLVLISYFCFSVEDSISSFTATYAVKHFGWTKSLASYVTSVYWTSFSLGSFSGIFIATYFPISKLLLFYSMMLLSSTICLLVTSIYNIDTGLWVFTAVSGVSVSLNFPLLFAWVEEDFLHVTAKVTSVLTISASIGVIVSPIIVGVVMEMSTVYYSYFVFANSVMLFLLLCVGKVLSLKAKIFRRRAKELEIKVDGNDDDGRLH